MTSIIWHQTVLRFILIGVILFSNVVFEDQMLVDRSDRGIDAHSGSLKSLQGQGQRFSLGSWPNAPRSSQSWCCSEECLFCSFSKHKWIKMRDFFHSIESPCNQNFYLLFILKCYKFNKKKIFFYFILSILTHTIQYNSYNSYNFKLK